MALTITALTAVVEAQNVTSSPLPIVLINTDGNATIQDAYKIPGTMKILYVNDSTINYLSNQNDSAYVHYQGRIGIEKRGSTSQNLNKRHYGFETRQADDVTNDNVSLLGMPAENDWILNPLNYDNTYLRDPLSYALANRTGHYAPRTKYCEVFLGGNYRGIYFLTEKIKVDKNRVNLAKMDSTDNSFPDITGGYIIKADKTTGGDPVAWSTPAHSYWQDVDYIHHYPKPENVTNAQSTYIQNYFAAFQTVMDSADNSVETGYPSLIDVPSFVDYMIIGELTSNVDIYQKSTFFYKDRQGKLCAGPVWDFNCAYGNDPFSNPGRSGYDVWQFDNDDNTGSEFWIQLFYDPQFHRLFARRWYELTAPGAPLSYESVIALVDSLDMQIIDMVARDKQRWGYNFSHTTAVQNLKSWLQNRYTWINTQLTDTANTLPPVPNLAITKIHYHPHAYGNFSSDDLEFLGITNLTDSVVALTGVYFRELGISYQFPANTFIDSAQEIYIAADTTAFRQRYGVSAVGAFARDLSNSSERLVLADAWGRVIDDVTYQDCAPWPEDADGDGPFLTLTDPFSDNSQGNYWSTENVLYCPNVESLSINIVGADAALSWVSPGASRWEGLCEVELENGDHVTLGFETYQPNVILEDLRAGVYRLSVWAICGSSFYSGVAIKDTFVINRDAIADFENVKDILIYPNPTHGSSTITLQGIEEKAMVSIIDVFGRVVQKKILVSDDTQLSVDELPNGLYVVNVATNRRTVNRKLVVRK